MVIGVQRISLQVRTCDGSRTWIFLFVYPHIIAWTVHSFGAVGNILFVILAIEFTMFLLSSMISGIIILYSICFREHVQCREEEGDKARQRKTQRKATITILLITGAAMICNTTVVICFVLTIVFEDSELPMELVNIALCLNSCINPLLYITRNRDIRTFIKNIFKLKCIFCNSWAQSIRIWISYYEYVTMYHLYTSISI